jgi:hypothetical protein
MHFAHCLRIVFVIRKHTDIFGGIICRGEFSTGIIFHEEERFRGDFSTEILHGEKGIPWHVLKNGQKLKKFFFTESKEQH